MKHSKVVIKLTKCGQMKLDKRYKTILAEVKTDKRTHQDSPQTTLLSFDSDTFAFRLGVTPR